MRVKNIVRIIAASLFLVAVVSVQAEQTEVLVTYYTGCDTLTQVGQSFRSCINDSSSCGTLAGDWRQVDTTSCASFDTVTTYWEHCGTSWVQRTTLGAC